MKNKNRRSPINENQRKASKRMRFPLLSLLFVSCIAAVVMGGSILSPNLFHASAQFRQDESKNNNPSDAPQEISESARQQIAALVQEKMTRTAGRKKMDSQLIYGIKMERGEQLAPGLDTLEVNIPRNEEGQPIIDITAKVTRRLLAKLEEAGAKVLVSMPRYRTLRVEMSLDAVDTIADLPEVIHLQPKQEAMTSQKKSAEVTGFDSENLQLTRPGFTKRQENVRNQLLKALSGGSETSDLYSINVVGVRKSEGDTTGRVAFARNNYGFDGTGIKIGVISDGVRNLASAQESGDLGPVTVLPGQSGTAAGQCAITISCDEGTAMLEIVHDLAPGAQLYFATGLPTSANFAQNIRDLRTAGCDIIIDDLFYFAESPFQDGQAPAVVSSTNGGVVAQAVNDVTAGGALYFSSAGNSGNDNDGTSGVWEGDFVDGGPAPAPIGAANGNLHQFPAEGATPAQTFNVLTVASGPVILNWSDPLGGSGNDYDLYALNAAGTTVSAASTSTQDGNDDPFEGFNTPVAGSRIVIAKFSGVGRFLRISTNRGQLTVDTAGQTSGHSTAANAFGVAATPGSNLSGGPFPGPHTSANTVETFSSDGPRKLFYQPDGTPFTPGNVSSTGGITRQKPDITATDQVSVTGTGGFPIIFGGTSAAAPHAGAVAALIKSANPSYTTAQIRTALTTTAIDIEAAGVDRDSGSGIVMADAAFASLGLLVPPANVSLGTPTIDDLGGNNNDYLDPGESATADIQLVNTGIATATTVSGTLSSTTPGVIISSPTRSYPDIAANGGTANPVTPFTFFLQPSFVYASDIDFVLTVTYNGGTTRAFPFKVPTGQLANISTTLDTTSPGSGANYTGATGTQTGRPNFSFPLSACGAAKANPGTTSTLARRYDSFTFTNTSASTICVTVLLAHSSTALLHVNAYLNSFVPATPTTNFAGNSSGSTTNGAGTAQLFSFNVPASATFVLVVSESNQNGGLGVPYNLRVTGLPAAAVPTAAQVSAGGKVTDAFGRGLANVRVFVMSQTGQRLAALTNAFGYYRFDNLLAGQTYFFTVESKRYTFSNPTQVINLAEEQSGINFVADN